MLAFSKFSVYNVSEHCAHKIARMKQLG